MKTDSNRSYAQLRRDRRKASKPATEHVTWGDLEAMAVFCGVPITKAYAIAQLVEMAVAQPRGK